MEAPLSNYPDDPNRALALLDQLRDIHTAPDYPGLPLDTKLLIEAVNAPQDSQMRVAITRAAGFGNGRNPSVANTKDLIAVIDGLEEIQRCPGLRGAYHFVLSALYQALDAAEADNAKAASNKTVE